MALLIGEYESAIDSKHRLAISAGLREQIDPKSDGKDFIVVLGPDFHLWLYPDQYYRRLLATLRPSPLPDPQTQRIDVLFGLARPVKCDAQGRVVIPERPLQRAVIADRLTLVGVFDHIEVWPTDQWEQHVRESLPNYGKVVYEAAEQVRRQMAGSPPPRQE
jgi:MraZ protein